MADSHVLRLDKEAYWVWSARTGADVLRSRLEHYLIADEVDVVDESASWQGAVVWGAGAKDLIAQRFGAVPAPGAYVAREDAMAFAGRFSREDNFICLTRALPGAELVAAFVRAGARQGTRDALEAERIRGGLPAVPDDIGPDDLPNEGGLEDDAISYTKGCYLGQEVMSRLKHLGQVRRRLLVVEGEGEIPPDPAPVFQGEKRIGELRSRARVAGGFVAMAMLSLVHYHAAQPLTLSGGAPLRVRHG